MTMNLQKAHYETIHDSYERHYYDSTSLDYRRRFIFPPLLHGLELSGKRIADIASGSGWNTQLLKETLPGTQFHGYDISQRACENYSLRTGFPATCCDLLEMNFQDEPFDAAIVVGGLHHMVSDLPRATGTIANMIKPGGYLLACEPNATFFLNGVRKFWYRHDAYFQDDTERPLTVEELREHFAGKLELMDVRFLGGPAYIFILNSLVSRVPLWTKRSLAGLLTAGEIVYNTLPGRAAFPAFVARWIKVE